MKNIPPLVFIFAFWNLVLTATAAYWARGFMVEPIKPVKAEMLSAQVDHIIYRTVWWRIRDCRTMINRFVLGKSYYDGPVVSTVSASDAVVGKNDVTYHRSSVSGWSKPNLPVPQLRSSVVYIGGLHLPESRELLLAVVTDSFCPMRNRQNPYKLVPFMVPSGSDEGVEINRYDYGP